MSSLPQVAGPPSSVASVSIANATFQHDYFDPFLLEKLKNSPDTGNTCLLSFRGIALEPERFSAHCGLEGIYLPGRRWRRKLEIIQPVEIHFFYEECNSEDILCVQIKNVSPAHIPNIIIYLNAITIVSEKAAKGGPPLYLPIASIDTGNGHSLPNLPLRRESKLFFKQPANWRPHISRDLIISIAAESDERIGDQIDREPQLPVKVLTLRVTDLTSEDLTFTVLAPETASSPSGLSLSSTPKTSMNFSNFHDYLDRMGWGKSYGPHCNQISEREF